MRYQPVSTDPDRPAQDPPRFFTAKRALVLLVVLNVVFIGYYTLKTTPLSGNDNNSKSIIYLRMITP